MFFSFMPVHRQNLRTHGTGPLIIDVDGGLSAVSLVPQLWGQTLQQPTITCDTRFSRSDKCWTPKKLSLLLLNSLLAFKHYLYLGNQLSLVKHQTSVFCLFSHVFSHHQHKSIPKNAGFEPWKATRASRLAPEGPDSLSFQHIHELRLRGNRICLGNNCQPFQRVNHVNSSDKYMHKLFVNLTLFAKSRTVFVASMCLECIMMYHWNQRGLWSLESLWSLPSRSQLDRTASPSTKRHIEQFSSDFCRVAPGASRSTSPQWGQTSSGILTF